MRLKKLNWNRRIGFLFKAVGIRTSELVLFSLIILSGYGCGGEEALPKGDNPPVKDETATQYGVPFENVPDTEDIIMYEVNLSAFSSSGDLAGVQGRLDSLQSLGVNTIWLMPIYSTGELKSVGSPYAVRNYKQVNPEYGNLENLRSLVEEAHERDMAVILDWVANHTAWDHRWIQNPTWYTRDDSGNIISPAGMGWTDVADLNYSSQVMRGEMIDAMKYWVLEANVDGYRCDYAEGVPTDFWKQAIDTLRNIPDREIIMFAEAGDEDLFSAGFDLIFGWDFYNELKKVFNDNVSASALAQVNAADYNNVPEGSHILRWITNHDDNAWDDTPVGIFNGQEGALAAFVLSSYMGGVPLIYNGQEVGYPDQLSFFENNTTKIDWTINTEIYAEYKKLVAFRNNSEAVKSGSIQTYHSDDVVAFKRISGTEEILVLVNVRNQELNYELPSSLANTAWKNAFTDEAVTLNIAVPLEPYDYLILKK